MNRATLMTCLVALMVPSLAKAQMADHPIYLSWARCEPGTTLKIRTETRSELGTIESTSVYKLVGKTDDQVDVEVVVTSEQSGEQSVSQPQVFNYKRKFPLLPGVKAEDLGKPRNAIDQGKEVIEAAGQQFETVWYDSKSQTEAGEAITRTWMSEEMPGRLVKAVTRVPAVNKVTTIEVTELTTP